MGLKVAVVGGGSTYTPELVEGIASRENRLTSGHRTLSGSKGSGLPA